MEGLTARQRDILQFIVDNTEKMGFPPTIREIGIRFQIRSTNGVNDHLKALERKGYLSRGDQLSRSMVATAIGRRYLGLEDDTNADRLMLRVPFVNGVLPGTDLLDPQNIEDHLNVDSALLPKTVADRFALRVRGEAMIDAGILSGDILFAKRQRTVRSGDLAVVLLDGDLAVRRLYYEGNRIRLQPANATMHPVYIDGGQPGGFDIHGAVIGLWRRYL